jgi:hypothetical protein
MPKVLCLNQRPRIVAASVSVLKRKDTAFKQLLTPEVLEAIVNLIPEEWLQWEEVEDSRIEMICKFLLTRLNFFYKGSTKCTRKTYEYAAGCAGRARRIPQCRDCYFL